jgi:DNA-binding CsgD family transcriptional regulator
VVVSGSAGVGKSRLLSEVAGTASEAGWLVERVFASRAVRSIPLGAISHLLSEIPDEDPSRVFHTAIGRLRRQARGRNVILFVDDAHDLDDGSAAFVRQLVVHGDARAVLAVRAESAPPDVVTALWKDGAGERLEVHRLGRGETDRLASAALGSTGDAHLLDEVWRITLGHPMYVLTGIRAALERGAIELADDMWHLTGPLVAEHLNELVRSRSGDLDPGVLRALELIAVGGPMRSRHLGAIVPEGALAALAERGLIGVSTTDGEATVSIGHPLYAEVLTQSLSPDRHTELISALAGAMLSDAEALPVERLRAAIWRLDADQPLEHDLALDTAREAIGRADFALAEVLLRAALTDRPDSVLATVALGRVFTFRGRIDEAETLLAGIDPSSDDEVAEVALARGHALAFVQRRPDDAAAVLTDAAARLDGPLRARLDSERALYGAIAGDFRAVFEATEAVLSNPESPELTLLTAHVNLGLARAMTGKLDGFDDAYTTALRLAEAHVAEMPMAADQLGLNLVAAWTADGRLVEAEQLARERVSDADVAGSPNPLWLAWHGYAAGQQGQLAAAIDSQQRAIAVLEVADPFRLHAQSVGLLAMHQAQSRTLPAGTDGLLEAAEQEAAGESRLAVWVGRAKAWAEAARGRDRAAAALAAQVGRTAVDHDHLVWGIEALHDAVRVGHPGVVVDAIDEAIGATSGARMLEAMADHATALAARDPSGLDAAAAAMARCGSPFLAAEASARAALVRLSRGEHHAASCAALRAELWHRRCPLAATPALDDLPESLSGRELEVVQLATEGLTSRDLADRLYVSVRTVDNHLHTVYRKLGISGRDELAALLADVVPTGSGPASAS